MTSRAYRRGKLLIAATVLLFGGCAAATRYQGIPPAELSDAQLVEELYSAAAGLGVEINRTAYLMAVRPEPAYVLTSSATTFQGSGTATYNAYAMPVGYGTYTTGSVSGNVQGVATTRYQYTDVNASARLGNATASAISRARQENYRERGMEVYQEYQRRVTTRRAETEQVIASFFNDNPQLRSRRTLVAAVAPWAAAEGLSDGQSILARTAEIIDELPRGDGLTGLWFGTFAQTTTTAAGEVVAFSEFVQIRMQDDDGYITGAGELGSGEVIELTGEIVGQSLTGTVANTTSAINVEVAAIVAPTQITGSFSGFGAGATMEGTFTLLR